jgi:tRNA dimethylallyltransferase
MDIGTAKVPAAERSVTYHCLDLVDPTYDYNIADYQRDARASVEALRAVGKLPVFCGGSGLYLRAALDAFNLDQGQSAPDLALRAQLSARADAIGAEAFHAELAARDPESAALIHPHNVRRVVRAFEFLAAGSTYAQEQASFSSFAPYYQTLYLGIDVDNQVLYGQIDRRVAAMFAQGLVAEVRGLRKRYGHLGQTASQAIGYKQLLPLIQGSAAGTQPDAATLAAAQAQIAQETRHFAKRQRTWFKRDARIHWIDATAAMRACLEEVAAGGDTQQAEKTYHACLLTQAELLVQAAFMI